jgi:HPt (histidine-containing phosphotransfer) domain-containing protein
VVPEYLVEIFAEDPATATELLELFLEDTAVHLRNLNECFLVNDMRAISSITHTLKGSALQLGAPQLAYIAEAIESNIDHGHVAEARQFLLGLATAWDSLYLAVSKKMAAVPVNEPKLTESGSSPRGLAPEF